jgi:hypothetical protein
VQVEEGGETGLDVSVVLHHGVSLAVDGDIPDVCHLVALRIHQQDTLAEAGAEDTVLQQNLPLEQQDSQRAFRPGGDLVGIDNNGFRLAGHIARYADQIISMDQGRDSCRQR